MNRFAFIAHTAMNHKPDQQEQPCQHCGKICQNERKLKKHIYYYHTVVQCDVCNESFDQRMKLYEHKQRQSWNIKNIIPYIIITFFKHNFRNNKKNEKENVLLIMIINSMIEV